LLNADVAPTMPVAFIENASRSEQRVVVTTVDGMHRDAVLQQIKAPTLMIIGNVASSAVELQWFGRAAMQASG
jgi:siroheme synthase